MTKTSQCRIEAGQGLENQRISGNSKHAAMPYRTVRSVIGSIYPKPSFEKVYPPDQNITKMNGANRQKYFFAILSIYVSSPTWVVQIES